MTLFDKLIVQLRDKVNGVPEPIDQTQIFYKNRQPGLDFLAPFSVANVNYCQGTVTEIDGIEPIDYWLVIVDKIDSIDHEYLKERTEFLGYDLNRFDIMAEVLADSSF